MKLSENIDGTLARWQVEIQECREAMYYPPKAKPNILDRLVVEMDYLLVEASTRIAYLESELKRITDIANEEHASSAHIVMRNGELEEENERLKLQRMIDTEALRDAKVDIESAIYNEDGLDGIVGAHTLAKVEAALGGE